MESTDSEQEWFITEEMEIDDIKVAVCIEDKKKYKKTKVGRGIAKAGYRNDYNLYPGSTVFNRVIYICFIYNL